MAPLVPFLPAHIHQGALEAGFDQLLLLLTVIPDLQEEQPDELADALGIAR